MIEEQEAVRGRLFTIQDVMKSTVRAWLQVFEITTDYWTTIYILVSYWCFIKLLYAPKFHTVTSILVQKIYLAFILVPDFFLDQVKNGPALGFNS